MNEQIIGANIRQWRQKKGMTLSKIAEQAGLTKSALSKIENGQISSPVSTLMRIADALAVPLAEFFAEDQGKPPYVLTRKGKGDIITRDGSQFGYSYEALALKMPQKAAEPFLLSIKPDDPPGEFQHGGDEFIYMLSGKLEMVIGEESLVLKPGDSIYFDPKIPHSAQAMGKTPARYLCVFVQDKPQEG